MIVIRQKEFDDKPGKNKKGPQMPKNEEELRKVLKEERDKGFRAGEESGERNAIDRLRKIQNRKAKVIEKAKKVAAWGKKNKKALIITGAGLAASGATIAGVKAIKKSKEKKASDNLKKRVRGYDNTKKKA